MNIITLSPEIAERCGYDTSDIDEWPIKRIIDDNGFIDFEESNQHVNIMFIRVDVNYRRQGIATRLLEALKDHIGNKTVSPGHYTADGEKFLRRKVEQLFGDRIQS